MAIDPVCLMEVDEATAQWTSEYQGKMYYFCAPGCKTSFDEDPEKYLSALESGEAHQGHDHAHHTDPSPDGGADHETHDHAHNTDPNPVGGADHDTHGHDHHTDPSPDGGAEHRH